MKEFAVWKRWPGALAANLFSALLHLRDYTIKHDEMSAWIDEWRLQVAPLRRRHGFLIVGAWTIDGTDRFIWIMKYDGPKTFGQADSDYYQSRERKAMEPDPARHIAHSETRFITSVVEQGVTGPLR